MVLSELQPAKQKNILSLSSHMASQPLQDPSSDPRITEHLGQRSLAWFAQKQGFTLQLFVIGQFLNYIFPFYFRIVILYKLFCLNELCNLK